MKSLFILLFLIAIFSCKKEDVIKPTTQKTVLVSVVAKNKDSVTVAASETLKVILK